MARDPLSELVAFVAVTRERSFTRAAAQLGVSPSAVSHTMKALEERTGVRLLTRTTRSVSPTEAGERLYQVLAPRFDEIQTELAVLGELRDKPAGTIRITATDHSADTILWPKLGPLLRQYPDLKIEIINDYGLSDIVAQRYDMGVRQGDQVSGNMIAVRIAPDVRFAVVGSPAYLKQRPAPDSPQDLTHHNCINLRLPTHGGLLAWELQFGKRKLQVRVEGQATFNGTYQMLNAAIDGAGLAYLPEDLVRSHVKAGRLCGVLEAWWPTFPGLHLYYATRRQSSRAVSVVVEALRYVPPKSAKPSRSTRKRKAP
jgi:DNA-binding transcriptional LysR family regulator